MELGDNTGGKTRLGYQAIVEQRGEGRLMGYLQSKRNVPKRSCKGVTFFGATDFGEWLRNELV